MTRCWSAWVVAASFLGAGILTTNCHAHAQEQSLSETAEKSASPGESSNRNINQSETFMPLPELPANRENHFGPQLLRNIVSDQEAMWMSPKNLRFVDLDWLLPLGIATGGMLATDTEYSRHLSNSPSHLNSSENISNYGIGSLVGIEGGFYLWGRMTHDDHEQETSILGGEAALDSLAMTYALKSVFRRQRPLVNNDRGSFWAGGDSFPSEHAAAAWSIASIIAHEYPGPLTSLLTYGMASLISASRIDAKQHFSSDVLIGSTIGWLVGQHVYRSHHNPILGGGEWETYAEHSADTSDRNLSSRGSPYVELDSWIYPALERLAALGYINSEFLAM
jgi:membrane-associated phospholipid phosphatase